MSEVMRPGSGRKPASGPGSDRFEVGTKLSPKIAARWFKALYDVPMLYSGILNEQGRVLDANQLAVEGCGLVRSEILGRPFWEAGWWSPDPALADRVEQMCHRVVSSLEPVRIRTRFFHGDGSERIAEIALYPVEPADGGDETYIVAVGLDVTEAVAAETERAKRKAIEAEREAARQIESMIGSMQESLLTRPPAPAGFDIAARYLPAVRQAKVGGDWFDAFTTRSGALLASVGDVAGHDGNSAAVMAQLRNLLRGIASDSDDGPAELMRRLDRVIAGFAPEAIASALIARVDPHDGALVWSSAGHPPPLLRRTSGEVERLADPGGLMLGCDPDRERLEYTTELGADATLLLYTDGLIERRGEGLDAGLARLVRAFEPGGAERDAARVCDRMVGSMLPEPPTDDVAVMVVRAR